MSTSQPVVEKVIAWGDKDHQHKPKIVEWDPAEGLRVTDIGEFYAAYRERLACSCGYEVITKTRSLL